MSNHVSIGRGSGRRAALPPTGYAPAARVVDDTAACRVRFVPENPAQAPREFDFTGWPVNLPLRQAFATAFAERTRPGGRVRTSESAYKTFRTLRQFAEYLAGLVSPPTTAADLTSAHLDGWFHPQRQHAGGAIKLGELKTTLRKIAGTSKEFRAALARRNPPRANLTAKTSYSRSENRRILNAARADIRRAADRIRGNRDLLRRWRAGDMDTEPGDIYRRGELLDFVDRHLDVPRYASVSAAPKRWVSMLGAVEDHMTALHLSSVEVAAFAVLLIGLTGQNKSTILTAPAAHHRPDGYTGHPSTAIVKLDKPRRGARRHMDVPLTGVPTWVGSDPYTRGASSVGEQSRRVDLHSAFGVYMLLHELAAPARHVVGTDRLFVFWAGTGAGVGRGLRTTFDPRLPVAWAQRHDLPTDTALAQSAPDGQREQLQVTFGRLRLTYNELQQRPVAHTETTLANEYLARNRGNLVEYQQVVAAALAEQVTKASTRARLHTLSEADVVEARTHPARVAARHGMDTATLQRVLAGELDTVVGACVDHTNSPHTVSGQACRASFMLCLSCPCARALPTHLPLQVLVHDGLRQRKSAVTPLRWAQRFALPHAQLADLLDRAGPAAVADARHAATPEQRELAERFLRRELDLL
ncbi:hypothetical protein HFP15_36920 [Amycolatopsis sp. K13G38]|uniref:Core-binding (CB) domain-containing protein n=1 Tax=Amycolatopsis acididurans TaxID=2724524 RepID=A0ABX1JJM3_9PSEU|nr:hypothetical protein [Amycolatopsis acididurans]NKQ58447.1 hypothetical protein [Amycolatopsis acididurans]